MEQRLQEIEVRKSEIRTSLDVEGVDLKALNEEIDTLNAEAEELRGKIKDLEVQAEAEKELRQNILKGTAEVRTIEKSKEERGLIMQTREEILSSKEYRNLWLKKLQGSELSVEERAGEIILSQVAGATPTETYAQIISKLRETAPLLNEITLLQVAGNVNFAIEGTMNAAAIHTENGAITPAADTLVTVSLAGFEVVKLLRISATVKTMTINAFESWIIEQLAEQVGLVIENWIINGSGSSQPKGIDYSNTWTDGTNAVDYTTNITYAELVELVSYLKGGYARKGKFVMNHKTFWQQIQAIRDDSKAPIVERVGEKYFCMGIPVVMSDYVNDGDIFFGDLSKIVGNLSQGIEVKANESAGFDSNSIHYRGTAMFDCDVALAEAFVKAADTL